jgi:hypothetical protein
MPAKTPSRESSRSPGAGEAPARLARTRRHFFGQAGFGIGGAALGALLSERGASAAAPAVELGPDGKPARGVHHQARAKSVIFLSMPGAPSQLELFDHKPLLRKYDGQPIPESFVKGERFAFIKGVPRVLGSPYEFKRHGQSAAELSELLPHTAKIADQLAIVRTMHTTQFNHAPAQIFMNTGHQIPGRPSMGSWLSYGIGSENEDLPAFVVLVSGENAPDGGKACWSSGFLPTVYQGVEFRSKGDPVLYLTDPEGMSREDRRASLDLLKTLNARRAAEMGDPEIQTRIAAAELAYRMQASVPELTEIAKEPEHVRRAYGVEAGRASFSNNCLLARRLVERGVRFVQLYHRGWDTHGTSARGDLVTRLPQLCREIDQASAALVTDLAQRGLLDSTLVVWGGEFGRTPMNEERDKSVYLGRDHHPRAFTMWLAGGGVRRGVTIGRTDDFGYNPIEDPVSVHDLQATVLHQMGIDHTRLVYKFQGRYFRLTDVHGEVVKKLVG